MGTTTTHIADDLARIHKVITRGLRVTREHASAAVTDQSSGKAAHAGLLDFARCTLSVLRSHHALEEMVAFPRLAKLTGAPFAELEAQHRELLAAIDVADAAIVGDALESLALAMSRIETQWRAHIAIEERHFTIAAVDGALDPAEQAALGRAVGEFAAQNSKPEELVLPFIIYNLDGADRAAMAGRLPPIVTEQLIPGPWRARWAPMEPLLLR